MRGSTTERDAAALAFESYSTFSEFTEMPGRELQSALNPPPTLPPMPSLLSVPPTKPPMPSRASPEASRRNSRFSSLRPPRPLVLLSPLSSSSSSLRPQLIPCLSHPSLYSPLSSSVSSSSFSSSSVSSSSPSSSFSTTPPSSPAPSDAAPLSYCPAHVGLALASNATSASAPPPNPPFAPFSNRVTSATCIRESSLIVRVECLCWRAFAATSMPRFRRTRPPLAMAWIRTALSRLRRFTARYWRCNRSTAPLRS